ncbi:MAG: N-acetylmuramoyl-L-alanine amidase, partial [Elusimicrobia bacterium]|nr:N-acetylmuramoyl-L-alanine amidase [Elusimicrobiota bacterium]
KPTPAQLLALRRWLAYLVYAYKISPTMILGHQEFDHTDCPGIYLERYHEDLEPYVAAKASPLRRIRMSLLPLWWRIEAQHGGVASSGREKR